MFESPYKGLESYTKEDALFFFGRDEQRETIINNLEYPLTVVYGKNGVGKTSVLQAGVTRHLLLEQEDNRRELGVPKLAVVFFKDWNEENLLDALLKQVKEAVEEAMQQDLDFFKEQFQESIKKHKRKAKKEKISSPSEFVETLKAWTEILSGKYGGGKLLIILDQFEDYFLYHSQDFLNDSQKNENKDQKKTFTDEFARAVKYSGSSLKFLISIQSNAYYKLLQFKSRLPSIVENCLELKFLDQDSAEEAIRKPLERYNCCQTIIHQFKNFRLTVLSGETNAGKSFILREGVVRYLCQEAESSYPTILFNSWDKDKDPLDELVKQIQEGIKSFLDEQGQDSISDSSKLSDTLAAWDKYIKEKHEDRKLFIILDQFEQYLQNFKNNSQKNKGGKFEVELRNLLRDDSPVNFLISIQQNAFEDLKGFIDTHWCDHYLELSQDSVTIKPLEDQSADITKLKPFEKDKLQQLKIKQAFIESAEDSQDTEKKRTEFINKIIEGIRNQRSGSSTDERSQENPIVTPFLQVVMTELWKKAKSREGKRILSLEDEGIEEIIQQYVDSAIEKVENNVEPKIKSKSLNTVSRVLYYLSTPSGSKCALSVREIVACAEEDAKVLKGLDLPKMEENEDEIGKILDQLDRPYRILQKVGASPKQDEIDKRYEIYFDGLIPALQSWRTKYISQLRRISLKQILPTASLAQFRRGQKELAALLARRAYWSHKKLDYPKDFSQVDATLREILKYPYFSCSLDCYDSNQKPNKRDFWQVKFNSDGTMLAASNQDGSLWVWDVGQESKIPKLIGWKEKAHYSRHLPRGYFLDISIAFSQDNKMLISSGRDGKIKLWDLHNLHRSNRNLLQIGNDIINPDINFGLTSVSVIPPSIISHQDRKKFLASCNWSVNIIFCQYLYLFIRALELLSYSLIRYFFHHLRCSRTLNGNILLWDISEPITKNKQPISIPVQQKPSCRTKNKFSDFWLWSVDVSPDGNLLAAGGSDGIVYLWNIENPLNPTPKGTLTGHEKEIFYVAFSPNNEKSPNGKYLATACRDQTVKLWKLDQINQISNYGPNPQLKPIVLKDHKDCVRSIAFDRYSNKLASASEDQTVRIWNLESLEEKIKLKEEIKPEEILRGHSYGVCSVAFDPKEPQCLVSCSWDRTIGFWNLESEPKIFEVSEKDSKKEVLALTWIDGKRFAWARSDGRLEVRKDDNNSNLDKPIDSLFKLSKHISSEDVYTVTSFEIWKQKKIAVGNQDGLIWVWDIDFNIDIQEQKIPSINPKELVPDQKYKITSLAFSPDGKWLASASDEQYPPKVILWDLSQSKPKPKPIELPEELILNPVVKHHIKLGEARGKRQEAKGLKVSISSIAFFPKDNQKASNEKWLAVADKSGNITLSLWNLSESKPKLLSQKFGKHDQYYGDETSVLLAFSKDGNLLASFCENNDLKDFPCVKLWSVNQSFEKQSEELICRCDNLSNYNFSPTSVAFSNDSQWLALGSYDGSIRMWNLEKLCEIGNSDNKKPKNKKPKIKIKPSSILQGHKEKVIMLAFSPDGKKLLSASYDNTVRLWTVETEDLANELKKKLYRRLTELEKQEFLGVSPQLQNRSESS